MQKQFPTLITVFLIVFSAIIFNIGFSQRSQNAKFIIDTTKSIACNISLNDYYRKNLEVEIITLKVNQKNSQKTEENLALLNAQLLKMIEVYSKEKGSEFDESTLIYEARDRCLSEYSFSYVEHPDLNFEDERTELLLYFNAYLTSIDIPKLNDTIFNIEDFEKDENGLYILKFKGEKFQMSHDDLEAHMKTMIKNYLNLIHFKNDRIDYFSRQYSGKSFSKMDLTEQLMFKFYAQREIYRKLINNVDLIRRQEEIINNDSELQSLILKYEESTEINKLRKTK